MFLFDADKAANGGIFHELWAIVRNFAMTSGLRLAAAIIVLLLGLKIAKAVLKRYEKSRAFQKIVPDVRGVVRWLAGFLLYALIIVLVIEMSFERQCVGCVVLLMQTALMFQSVGG